MAAARKKRVQGIYMQSPRMLRRLDQMLDADREYSAIQEAIFKEFRYRLTGACLSKYFQKREREKEERDGPAHAPGAGPMRQSASVTITISGPVSVAIVCEEGAEGRRQ